MSGLRERKKLATRAALGAAARSLAVEVGTENVRVADIADRAGVAPRTYNGYFGSREEAICALYADRAGRIADALRARPADQPLLAAITAAITAEFLGPDPDRAALRLITRDPALRGEYLKDLSTLEAPLAAAIQDRLPDPLTASAIAAATVAVTRVALTHWLDSPDDKPFPHHATQALEALTNLT
ncbi:TetR/AcrR family transcriptional regulator [Kribbella sp. NPDC000426]|uniref:TetR/AcrR family transcriptional regulator n=1 Tax=Kribbella sp. NPDC000426 TaxID=3154255 RepID=UPI003330F393